MSSSIRRYAYIDSLRAIAIIGVITVHTSQWTNPSWEFLRQVTAEGARGVQLFFVASALTIFLSIKSRYPSEDKPSRNFFIRRFFRIAPLFYSGIVLWLLLEGFAPRYWAPKGINSWTVLLTSTFLHGVHPETITSLVPGGWSITVEMTFYLFAPALFRYILDMRRAILFFAVTLFLNVLLSKMIKQYVLGFYSTEYQYLVHNYVFLWFFAQLPVFALGLITYHARDYFASIWHPRLLGLFVISLVPILWLLLLRWQISNSLLPIHVLYAGTFVLLTIALSVYPAGLLVNPVMSKIGKISFSLYISHFIILHLCAKSFFPGGFPLRGNTGFLVAWLFVTIISCMVSLVTYRYIERPGIEVGRRLINYFERSTVNQGAQGVS